MLAVAPPTDDLHRVIPETLDRASEGELPEDLDADLLRELYDRMVLLRTYDERSLVYHRHGRIGTYAIYWGHEAMQVGAVTAMDDEDWVVPSYRESAVALMRGMPPSTCLAWWRGHPDGWWDPREYRTASISVPVGSHVPHAVGLAWGERLQGRDAAALAFFGDGATSEGDFHEGANFAAVLELPVVLLCNNNQWAISTPLSKQTRAETLADKAVGYGIRGVRVDGNDVVAVYRAVREAVEHGKQHGQPTFIECVSWRPHLHATADDPERYRDESQAGHWRENDCLSRYESWLLAHGVIDRDHVDSRREECLALMARSIEEAEALAPGTAEDVFDHVYSERPAAFDRDLAEIRASREDLDNG